MAGRRWQQFQHGAALLVLLVVLVLASLTYLVKGFSTVEIEARRQQKTAAALTTARDALIGYALKYRDEQIAQGQPDRVYGYLPLPDLGTSRNNNSGCTQEGCDAANFDGNALNTSVVGRLPWFLLGTAPLRDAYGECLWYIVSGGHQRQQRVTPMNWDTLGQLDIVVANGSSALISTLTNAHERPIAVIFAPGPPLAGLNGQPGQDRRTTATDAVDQCGGNYDAKNYLDPATTTPLAGITNYLGSTNHSSAVTGDSAPANDPDTPKPLVIQGKIFIDNNATTLGSGCQGNDCTLVANDVGLTLSADQLFGALRKQRYFRDDLNSMLDRITSCLRDQIAAGSAFIPASMASFTPPADKSAGRIPPDACYDDSKNPLSYFSHYQDLLFVAKPATGYFTVASDTNCAGVLLFAGQRSTAQQRTTVAQRNTPANYLEADNLISFTAAGITFNGDSQFDRLLPQIVEQDIGRCIPGGASLTQVVSPALNVLGGQLTAYDPGTRILTLGRLLTLTAAQRTANAQALFGCSWMPEAHLMGNGLRSYFKFRISDTGEGFTFAIVDGERNNTAVCGAARQHLGYAGNNGVTPPITTPKIGIEIDTTRQGGAFNPATANTLNNGRSDPNYTGGHTGIVYWGGAVPIATSTACPCTAPRYCSAGTCYLPEEEDDNVHGWPTPPDPSTRPAPRNPVAPTTPTAATGVYKLDASLSQTPVNQDIHLRVELSRTSVDSTTHSNSWLLEVWLLKYSATDANKIAAMKNTTRPMSLLYPSFPALVRDTPTLHDPQGESCTAGVTCAVGQTCGLDNLCYTEIFHTARLGFTTSQSTTANDQIINISDFFTTWLP